MNKRNQNKKSCLIQIEYSFHCSIYPTNNAMVSLKDAFTFWRQSQKEDFLSIINYIDVWLSMISGHGANPVFFNKKELKISRPEFLLPPPAPLLLIASYFCLTRLLPLTPKVDVICVSLPISVSTIKLFIISEFCTLKFWINNRSTFFLFDVYSVC